MKRFFPLLFLSFLTAVAFGQLSVSNGVGIPTTDTLRVLIVFAELDFDQGPCPRNLPATFEGSWGKDKKGNTMLPDYADEFFDANLSNGKSPKGMLTGYFHEASFGQHVLLGDYLPEIITIPCSDFKVSSNGIKQILTILDNSTTPIRTNSGFELKDFDSWTIGRSGEKKIKTPDGKIDLLYVIWRNNRFLTGPNTGPNSGYGVARNNGIPFKGMEGINNMASFNAAKGPFDARVITVAEHLHGIFGGNNWHSSGGRGTHTFLCPASNYGLTGQYGATTQSVSGWDRWMQKWQHPKKKFLISAMNESGVEVNTENINIMDNPSGLSVVLGDFVKTGDAVRIRLPYLDTANVKNQYLWLENRRWKSKFDVYLEYDCSDNRSGQFPKGTPGIYAYIQVGKDQRDGPGIYNSNNSAPNGTASPFFPLPADGRHDIHYRYDKIQGKHWRGCNFGKRNVPIDRSRSLHNPFTGHSDLFRLTDSNKDGKLLSGDKLQSGFSEVIRDTVVHTYYGTGDWKDAFANVTGNTRLAMYTNPAPVPVYTLATNFEFKRWGLKNGEPASFENRTIWLNGLSIDVIELDGEKIRLDIKWDSFDIEEDVRWCGNIVLSPNHIDSSLPSLILKEKVNMVLAHGESPTLPESVGQNKKGEHIFSEPTELTVSQGSVMKIEAGGKVRIQGDSKLIISKGAKLILDKKAKIIIEKGAELVIEEGAEIEKHRCAKILKR